MTEDQYNAMLDKVDALAVPPEFDSWKLTKQEVARINALSDEQLSRIQELLKAYTPQSRMDIRGSLALKAIAMLLGKVKDMRESFNVGYDAGVHT